VKKTRIKRIQRHLGLMPDGIIGDVTLAELEKRLGIVDESASAWPRDTVAALTDYYGAPGVQGGAEPDLVWFNFPYPAYLYGDKSKPVTRHRCHRKVKDSLEGILETIRDEFGMDFIKAHHLDAYYGCYNARKMRGRSRSISRHSWGIAIDLAAAQNGFRTPWPEVADMPVDVVEVFERAGWKSGARAWGKDAMHFQATQ
jgi:hypothetical protein